VTAEAILQSNVAINYIFLPFTSKGILHIFFNLIYLKWMTRKVTGVFHITGDIHYAILALPAERTILTIHDLVFLHTYKGLTRSFLKRIFLDIPVKKARYITTISEKSKQEIISNTDCDPQKIIVIPNPVDHSITFTQKNISNEKPVLLFIGVKPNKNLDRTIAAIKELRVHLRIVGQPSNDQLDQLRRNEIDFSYVHNISSEELAREYQSCDIVLFPSVYEGFGLPVIEGFQSGRPVISSNLSPMKDIARDAALLVDPTSIDSIRDGVNLLVRDESLRNTLVQRGSEVAKSYQPEVVAVQYVSLWQRISNEG
jgi:glycosyltransferase involved in cell wall biosynthesis